MKNNIKNISEKIAVKINNAKTETDRRNEIIEIISTLRFKTEYVIQEGENTISCSVKTEDEMLELLESIYNELNEENKKEFIDMITDKNNGLSDIINVANITFEEKKTKVEDVIDEPTEEKKDTINIPTEESLNPEEVKKNTDGYSFDGSVPENTDDESKKEAEGKAITDYKNETNKLELKLADIEKTINDLQTPSEDKKTSKEDLKNEVNNLLTNVNNLPNKQAVLTEITRIMLEQLEVGYKEKNIEALRNAINICNLDETLRDELTTKLNEVEIFLKTKKDEMDLMQKNKETELDSSKFFYIEATNKINQLVQTKDLSEVEEIKHYISSVIVNEATKDDRDRLTQEEAIELNTKLENTVNYIKENEKTTLDNDNLKQSIIELQNKSKNLPSQQATLTELVRLINAQLDNEYNSKNFIEIRTAINNCILSDEYKKQLHEKLNKVENYLTQNTNENTNNEELESLIAKRDDLKDTISKRKEETEKYYDALKDIKEIENDINLGKIEEGQSKVEGVKTKIALIKDDSLKKELNDYLKLALGKTNTKDPEPTPEIPKKGRKKVTFVKKIGNFFEKHPKIKLIALGLALLATTYLALHGLMVINSALWHIVPGPIQAVLHGINVGISEITSLGANTYVASTGLHMTGAGTALYELSAPTLIQAIAGLGVSIPFSKSIINKIKNRKKKDKTEEPKPEKEEPTNKPSEPEKTEEKGKELEKEIIEEKTGEKKEVEKTTEKDTEIEKTTLEEMKSVIETMNSQNKALEGQLDLSQQEKNTLKSENNNLKLENDDLKSRLEKLEEILKANGLYPEMEQETMEESHSMKMK